MTCAGQRSRGRADRQKATAVDLALYRKIPSTNACCSESCQPCTARIAFLVVERARRGPGSVSSQARIGSVASCVVMPLVKVA